MAGALPVGPDPGCSTEAGSRRPPPLHQGTIIPLATRASTGPWGPGSGGASIAKWWVALWGSGQQLVTKCCRQKCPCSTTSSECQHSHQAPGAPYGDCPCPLRSPAQGLPRSTCTVHVCGRGKTKEFLYRNNSAWGYSRASARNTLPAKVPGTTGLPVFV